MYVNQKLLPGASSAAADIGGAGRGATNAIKAFARLAPSAGTEKPTVRIFDPQPGKATLLAQRARTAGVDALAFEERIDDVVAREDPTDRPLALHIDQARGLTRVAGTLLEQGTPRPVFAQWFLRMADSSILSMLFAVPKGDERSLEKLGRFARSLEGVQMPGGYARFFDAASGAVPTGLEAMHRKVQADDVETTLPRLAAGLDLERHPIAIYHQGEVIPADILPSPSPTGWAKADRLAERVADGALLAERGKSFAIFELASEGIRLLVARNRFDRPEVEVLGTSELRPDPLDTERAIREAWTGIATRRAPLYMTE